MSVVERVDAYQREHSWFGFPLAVIYKFADDRGPHLAGLVTYYGFVSLFPMLLIFFSLLGFFLHGNAHLQSQLVDSALANFPIIGPQLRHNVTNIRGSGIGLAAGIVGTVYGATGAMQAAQAGFNRIYGVARNEQPNPLKGRLRSLGLMLLLGAGVLLSSAIATILGTPNPIAARLGLALRSLGYLLTFTLNVGLFTAAFQLLTARDLRLRDVIRGGIVAAGAWLVLQTVGNSYLAHRLDHAESAYGTFGVVLAAIAWIYVEALVLMFAAEINVVRAYRLWPRALLTPFTDAVDLTVADQRSYTMYAATERFKGFQTITTRFKPAAPDDPGHDSADDG